jgi:hypothetical protein
MLLEGVRRKEEEITKDLLSGIYILVWSYALQACVGLNFGGRTRWSQSYLYESPY